MTDTKHPEALRLAALYDADAWPGGLSLNAWAAASAAELRRLHAENTTLQQGYDAARLEIESLHARVQELERERAVAAEREACAKLVQDMSHHRRWVRAGINGEPIRPCEYAAAIRARGAQGESNG